MTTLKEKLAEKIEAHRPRVTKLLKDHCDDVLDQVTVGKLIGGMRGLKCLVTDISYLDPEEGIRYRGLTLPEVFDKLPKPPDGEMPYVEGLFYLLLTGDIPNEAEIISSILHSKWQSLVSQTTVGPFFACLPTSLKREEILSRTLNSSLIRSILNFSSLPTIMVDLNILN